MLSELLLTELNHLQHRKLPLHRRLYEALRRAILDGKLVADERLPSSRDLVQDLKLSRNTVVAALNQLTVEGYLVSRVGSGTFVNAEVPKPAPRRAHALTHQNSPLSHRGQSLSTQFCASELEVQPFTPGIADFSAFPVALWQRLQNKHWRMTYPDMLDYSSAVVTPHCAAPSPTICACFAVCRWMTSKSSLPVAPRSRWNCALSCWPTTTTRSGSKTRPIGAL